MQQSLSKLGFRKHELRTTQPETILNFLVLKLAKHKLLVSGSNFLPDYDDSIRNQVMIALNRILTPHFQKRAHLFFEYFIKVGLSCEIANEFEYTSEGERASVENYFHHIKLDSSANTISIAHASTGYFRTKGIKGSSDATLSDSVLQRQHQFGSVAAITSLDTIGVDTKYVKKRIISIYGLDKLLTTKKGLTEKAKEITTSEMWDSEIQSHNTSKYLAYPIYGYWKSFHKKRQDLILQLKDKGGKSFPKKHIPYFNLISGLTNDISSWHANYVRQLFSTTTSASGGRVFLISIHSLLALIGEICGAYSAKDESHKRDALKIFMETNHECPVPSRIGFTVLENSGDKIKDEGTEIENDANKLPDKTNKTSEFADERIEDNKFEELLHSWTKLFNNTDLHITPQLVNRISNRFHQALGQIDTEIADSNKYLGSSIHRYVVAFLNAVMIEEATLSNIKLIYKNAINADDIFLRNYKRLSDGNLPIFRWIFKCPVWGLYLQPKEMSDDKKTEIMDIYERHLFPDIPTSNGFSKAFEILNSDPNDQRKLYEEMIKVDFLTVDKVFDNLFAPLNSVLLQGHVR